MTGEKFYRLATSALAPGAGVFHVTGNIKVIFYCEP